MARFRAGATVFIVLFTLVCALLEAPHGLSLLNQARRQPLSEAGAQDYCFTHSWSDNPGGVGGARLPFIRWLRARMGAHAIYQLDYAPPPDLDCLILGLLPALPARPGERTQWTVAFGRVPPEMQRAISRGSHDVHVYGPGLALQQNGHGT